MAIPDESLPVPVSSPAIGGKRRKKAWNQTRGVVTHPGLKGVSLESQEIREAFELYLSLGDDRSLQKVAEQIGRRLPTVHSWSQKYHWVERVLAHEAEQADSLTIETFAEQREKRRFGLKMIDKILLDTVTFNADGTIKACDVAAKSPTDIRTLLTLRDELLNPDRGSKTFGKGSQINAENAVFIIKK